MNAPLQTLAQLTSHRMTPALLVAGLLLVAPMVWAQTAEVQFLNSPRELPSAFLSDVNFDYNVFKFPFIFTYTGTTTATFTFELEIELDNQTLLKTESQPVAFAPGVYMYQALDLGTGPGGIAPEIKFDSYSDLFNDGLDKNFRNDVVISGLLPEGVYLVTMTPKSPDVMGSALPLDFSVSTPEPPLLLMPFDEEVITQDVVVFNWLPVNPPPLRTIPEYKMRLVEQRMGQTRREAFESNRPYFESDWMTGTTLVYAFDQLPLEPDQDYVWGVKARLQPIASSNEPTYPFLSDGQTEYFAFHFLGSGDVAADTVSIVFDEDLVQTGAPAVPDSSAVPGSQGPGVGYWMWEDDADWANAYEDGSAFSENSIRTFDAGRTGNAFRAIPENRQRSADPDPNEQEQRATLGQVAPTRKVNVRGSVTVLGEAYRKTDLEMDRRAPQKAEANANVSFDLFGLYEAQLNLILSTDQSRFRQSSNRAGLDFQIGPLRLGGGDVAPNFSKYSLSGVTVRGGLLQLEPAKFHLSLAGGRAQRAIVDQSMDSVFPPTFDRSLYAARMGFGKKGGSYFAINGLYGFDQKNPMIPDSVATEENNYLLSPEFGLSFMDGNLTFENELGVTLYSRNRFEDPELEIGPIQISKASRASFAARTEMDLSINPFKMGMEYERVMPGYESMGLGQIREDQQLFRVQPQIRLFKRKLNVSLNFADRRNNLTGGRLVTTTRQEAGGRFTARIAKWFTLTSGYKRLTSNNPPRTALRTLADSLASGGIRMTTDTLAVGVNIAVQTINVSPVFTFRLGNMTNNLAFSSNYQIQENNRLPQNNTTFSGSANYSLTLPSNHGLTLGGTYVTNDAAMAETVVMGLQGGPSLNLWGGMVQVNLAGGWSRNEIDLSAGGHLERMVARQLTGNLRLSVRLPTGQPVQLTIRGLSNKTLEGMGLTFREVTGRISYTHNFN